MYQNREWLFNQYWSLKKSEYQIAKEQNLSRSCIHYWLIKLNVERRPSKEAIHLAKANYVRLSSTSIEFIEGELLGDGCITSRTQWSARYSHTSKYIKYCRWLSKQLSNFGINQSGKISSCCDRVWNCWTYRYTSLDYEELLSLRKRWYPKDKKIVPGDVKLTPLVCRQWYIGDGGIEKYNINPFIRLATYDFTIREIEFLCSRLQELDINCHPTKNKGIYIRTHSVPRFLDYIGPCPEEIEDIYGYKWRNCSI